MLLNRPTNDSTTNGPTGGYLRPFKLCQLTSVFGNRDVSTLLHMDLWTRMYKKMCVQKEVRIKNVLQKEVRTKNTYYKRKYVDKYVCTKGSVQKMYVQKCKRKYVQ